MEMHRDHLFDTRVVDRNIDSGALSREEYEASLANLPDSAEDAVESTVHMIFTRQPGRRLGEHLDDDGDEDEQG